MHAISTQLRSKLGSDIVREGILITDQPLTFTLCHHMTENFDFKPHV